MAKKKSKDQHKSGYLVRLPEAYRELLELLKKRHRRPTTSEVRIAVDKHLETEGIKPPA